MEHRARDSEVLAAAVLAVVVVAFAAFRATFAISFLDDGFYIAAPLRIARGAHLFVDEANIQAIGGLLAVPFVTLWHALFGVSGIVLASRLFYVALATLVGAGIVKALRPTFGPLIPLVAVCAVTLAPAYNTFAVSYNTVAQLAFMLCVALVFAARRDGSRAAAAGAGALAIFGCVSYPPLGLAAIPAAVASAIVLRDRKLWLWLLGGAGAMLGVAALAFFATAPLSDSLRALQYAATSGFSGQGGSITVSERVALSVHEIAAIVRNPVWWPSIALALLVALPRVSGRARGWMAALLPGAVALPGTIAVLRGVPASFGVPATSYLLACALALVPFAVLSAVRADAASQNRRRILLLGGVFSIVAMPLVALTTSAGFYRGMPGVGAAPLALAAIMCWLSLIGEQAGKRAVWIAIALLLIAQGALLFSVSYKDGAPFALDKRIAHGAAAGIATKAVRAEAIAQLERGIGTLAGPESRILVFSAPLVYALTDVEPLTYMTWLSPGSFDGGAVDYYDRIGQTPDIVVVSRSLLSLSNDSVGADTTDPLLTWITSGYTPAVRTDGFVIFRRR